MTESRAFVALDQGAATTSAALVGRVSGHWRLIAGLSVPADVPADSVVAAVVARARAADGHLLSSLGGNADPDGGLRRVVTTSARPREVAVLAVSERALAPLVVAAERTGWRVRTASAERMDPLQMTRMLLDPDLTSVLAGAGDPPGADERGAIGDLAAMVAAIAARRSDLGIVLAGAMAEQLPRFDTSNPDRAEIILAPAAMAGTPAGAPLRELLGRLRAPAHESRRAFVTAVGSLAEAINRRVEAFDIGHDAGIRAVASPGTEEPATTASAIVADAALVPSEPDETVVDQVLGWSTVATDRHRLRDRLRELRHTPWGDVPGDGGPLRLAAARAALGRLIDGTPELDGAPADLVVVSGGAWSIAPGPAIALAVADVVRRPGACQLTFDHARLLGPIGALEDPAERRPLLADLADDLLAPLGSVVMPQGVRVGRGGGRLVVHGASGSTELDLAPGGLELVDLPPGESAVAEFQFRDPVRLGTRGRHFAVDVAGGLGGLLVDLRDVPLRLPDRPERRRELLAAWQGALWAGLDS